MNTTIADMIFGVAVDTTIDDMIDELVEYDTGMLHNIGVPDSVINAVSDEYRKILNVKSDDEIIALVRKYEIESI